jgi:hypothetical protein
MFGILVVALSIAADGAAAPVVMLAIGVVLVLFSARQLDWDGP